MKPPPFTTNLSSQSFQPNPQDQTLTRLPPPLSFYLQCSQVLSRMQSLQSYKDPSPQLLSLSSLPGLKLKYEDFIRRREDTRRKIVEICKIKDEKVKEKELRKLIHVKPKMEEALFLQNMLRRAGSNMAFQKEILEIERDIELSNKYFQRLQGLWMRYENQLNDWKEPQNLGEIDDLLRSIWNDIYMLLIHDPILLEEFFRFGWFFQAKVLLSSSRTDHQFPYIKFCEDLKKNALEGQDEKRKKSSLYQRIEEELQKHKELTDKVKDYKQALDNGMDIERIDIGKIESLLRELKEFAFDVKEEAKFIEGILRKASQLRHLELLFEEENSLEEIEDLSLKKEETRESTPLEWERDQEEKVRKGFLVESPLCQIIETEQIPAIESPFCKIFQGDKSCPRESSCKDNEEYQGERLRKNLFIIESCSPKVKTEQSSSIYEQSFPVGSLKTELQKEHEEKMRSLVSAARVLLSIKKKLPFKLAEEICSKYTEHHVMMPDAEELFNIYSQEIKRIQRSCEELTNQLPVLTFEDLCMWSEKTRSIESESSLEGGYDEMKPELWLAKVRLIKVFWENAAKPSKPICLREICCLIVESENYEDSFKGINKAIFHDFVNFLKHLVEKSLREVQTKLNKNDKIKERYLKNGIIYRFIEVNKGLVREVYESKNAKKMAEKQESDFPKRQKDVSCKSLNQKRTAREVEDSEINLFNPVTKKQKIEVETKENVFISKNSQGSELKDGKELMKRKSDSGEILAGSETEQISLTKSEFNQNLAYLEQLSQELWNDESNSGWKLKKKNKDNLFEIKKSNEDDEILK